MQRVLVNPPLAVKRVNQRCLRAIVVGDSIEHRVKGFRRGEVYLLQIREIVVVEVRNVQPYSLKLPPRLSAFRVGIALLHKRARRRYSLLRRIFLPLHAREIRREIVRNGFGYC